MDHYVVTISREFGSLGRTVAQSLSEKLGVEFWDRDIVEAAARRTGHSVSVVSDEEETAKNSFFLRKKYKMSLTTYNINDEIFEAEKNIILDAANKSSCIIVGRCSDYILRDFPNHLSVYIYAPYEERLKNCIDTLMMDEKTARRMIREVDMARTYYQRKYCPDVRSPRDCSDLMIDSSRFGVEKTAALIAQALRIMVSDYIQ
ncbi:MAG: cytidylate kinase-like family protein [Lachnospiraceae bacterium]|nr:cytidylate kinase-like family protein [Lachnospiraceae bacterium]